MTLIHMGEVMAFSLSLLIHRSRCNTALCQAELVPRSRFREFQVPPSLGLANPQPRRQPRYPEAPWPTATKSTVAGTWEGTEAEAQGLQLISSSPFAV